jgi:serine/threonine protein phosphatase PrpC
LHVEQAQVSLIGGREDNQDRCALVADEGAALLAVLDGMGGHSDGALAAEAAQKLLVEAYRRVPHPLFDPLGFLHVTLGRMHDEVVRLGAGAPLEKRPRATVALCVVQDDSAFWAHVGDSRVYLIRDGRVERRTRDHSHVEFLIREGSITEDQALSHPLRNYVECCLGGETLVPEMSVSGLVRLRPGDIVLVCSDGLWGTLEEPRIAGNWSRSGESLQDALTRLAREAVAAGGANADNTTATAIRVVAGG